MFHFIAAALMTLQTSSLPPVQFVTSNDGTKIAYDVAGSGPVVILLHGGGQNRRVWHQGGYVARLAKEFTVVSIDLRGGGQSDAPKTESAYAFERINEDILASRSDRVSAMVYIGINFGAAVNETFMGFIKKTPDPPVWITAMIGYPRVEPGDMRCPTLWLVGTNNENAYASAKEYESKLAGTRVTLLTVEGLNHPQEFFQIDRVFPREVEFTRAYAQ